MKRHLRLPLALAAAAGLALGGYGFAAGLPGSSGSPGTSLSISTVAKHQGEAKKAGKKQDGKKKNKKGKKKRKAQVITITVGPNGYSPAKVKAKAGVPIILKIVSKNAAGCAKTIVFPSLKKRITVETKGTKTLKLPAQKKKGKLHYECSMGMYKGVIIIT